jgi:hypothetical protein
MKVRYLQGMGESRGPGILPGEVRDVSEEEAGRLITREIAVEDDGSAASPPADLPEPFSGYTSAKAKEIIEKVTDDELSLDELVALKGAERAGEGRSTVLEAVEEKLAPAEEALSSAAVVAPDGVTPGETPGWPVDAETGEPLRLPDQVREELSEAHLTIEAKEAELSKAIERAETAARQASETASSAKAKEAETAIPKRATKTQKSKKAAGAKKRKG